MGIFYTDDFPFAQYAAYSLGIIFILESIVFALVAAALATGAGAHTSFQTTPMAIVLIALTIVILYFLHLIRHPLRETKLRNMTTFSAICPVTFINALVLIIRVPSSAEGDLESDFSGLPNPRMVVHAVIIMSCFATVTAFLALYVSHNEMPPFDSPPLSKYEANLPRRPRRVRSVSVLPENTGGRSFRALPYSGPVGPPSMRSGRKHPPVTSYETYETWTNIPL